MTALALNDFISELDRAIKAGSPARRVQMLRQITNLFLSGADRLNEHQIRVFDDVLTRLMEPIDARALTQFSRTLADSISAPAEAVRRLARHEEANVAAPVLLKSVSISESDLIEIAGNRGRQHLLAISGRKHLNEELTDVLLKRGDTAVHRELARNAGARFSDPGYLALVAAAERDDDIADSLVLRSDMRLNMLRELLSRATKAVQTRLLRVAPVEMHEVIQATIESIEAESATTAPAPIDYSEAKLKVLALNKAGKLNDSAVNRFAVRGEHPNVVAALSLLADAAIETIEPLLEESDHFGLMVACRASRLNWHTTLAVINSRTGTQRLSHQELEQSSEAFEELCLSVAQRTIRFGSIRDLARRTNSTNSPAIAGASR